jgi:hypothetical protein
MMVVSVDAAPASAHAGGRFVGKREFLQLNLLYTKLLTDNSSKSSERDLMSVDEHGQRRAEARSGLSRAKVFGAVTEYSACIAGRLERIPCAGPLPWTCLTD